MPIYYAYLRVSTDTQDVASQKLGLLEYANAKNYLPLVMIEETASRAIPWKDRLIGKLLTEQAQPGDYVLTTEFTRLGGSPGQVFSMLETVALRKVNLIVTKSDFVLDGGLQSQVSVFCFSISSMIDIEFIRSRTKLGLQRARLEGRIGGRRKGSTGRLKLDSKIDRVRELHSLGLSVPKMAIQFSVTEKTMRLFINRRFPKKDK